MSKLNNVLIVLPAALLVAAPALARCRSHPCGSTTTQVQPSASEATQSSSLTPGPAIPLPENATPGQCFTRVNVPAVFETKTDQVLAREASERYEVVPATYETVTEQVLVTPASHKVVDVPATFETVSEQVTVSPARTEWQYLPCGPSPRGSCGERATGGRHQASMSGDKHLCLVEIPARYETVSHQEMVTPPRTATVDVPAVYRTVTHQVVKEPAHAVRIEIPAEYTTISHQELVRDATSEWRRIDCSSGQLLEPGPDAQPQP